MLDKIFGCKVHSFLHVLGMSVLAFGLPFNKVLMSIGAIWGVSNLVLEGDVKTYWTNIVKNKPFKWLLAFWFLHLIALFWTTDFSYAFHDLRIKLPLLAVPLALVARPIVNRNHVHYIFYALLASLVFTSILNFGFYQQWFGPKHYDDIRQLSLFGSHIRYGILIALGVGICFYFIQQNITSVSNWMWLVILTWFIYYTFFSQVLSGVFSLGIIFLVFILIYANKINKVIPWVIVVILLGVFYLLILYVKPEPYPTLKVSELPLKTKEGNFYTNDLKSKNRENNQRVFVSVCDVELEREWNKISSLKYDQKDVKGQFIRNTLIRYLTSKKLTKDAEGIKKLTKNDIENIENGIASIELLQNGILARFYGIKYQFENNFDPNGHSILQRLEYWKTGWETFQKNWLFGVGTGDVQVAFDQQYEQDKSILLLKNRLRAHNMYLTVGITFGVIGIFVFLGFWYSYFKLNFKNKEIVALFFFAVAIGTFLIEDTIETQMGVCLISLFLGLFMNKIEEVEMDRFLKNHHFRKRTE